MGHEEWRNFEWISESKGHAGDRANSTVAEQQTSDICWEMENP